MNEVQFGTQNEYQICGLWIERFDPQKGWEKVVGGGKDNTFLADGSWWYYGEGASGTRWYRMGSMSEPCQTWQGNEAQYTVEEAFYAGVLYVDPRTGTPYCELD